MMLPMKLSPVAAGENHAEKLEITSQAMRAAPGSPRIPLGCLQWVH